MGGLLGGGHPLGGVGAGLLDLPAHLGGALGQLAVPVGLDLGPVLLGGRVGGGDLGGGLRADPLQLLAGGGLVGHGPIWAAKRLLSTSRRCTRAQVSSVTSAGTGISSQSWVGRSVTE